MHDADRPSTRDQTAAIGLPRLNLPAFEPALRGDGDKRLILDPIRQQYVRLTPEEWVRQHFLRYLTQHCGYPASLMAIEKGFLFQDMPCRADILVHDRRGKPFLMVECKAPAVSISQSTFDQITRYNRVVSARYLIVTNGLKHYCWTVAGESQPERIASQPERVASPPEGIESRPKTGESLPKSSGTGLGRAKSRPDGGEIGLYRFLDGPPLYERSTSDKPIDPA